MHSPTIGKRRRISNEDEQESLRAKQVPRLYRSPDQPHSRDLSPGYRPGRAIQTNVAHPLNVAHQAQANTVHWPERPSRPAAYSPVASALPPPAEAAGRHGSRSGLPPLSRPQTIEQDPFSASPRGPSTSTGPSQISAPREGPGYHGQDYGYSYQQPPRLQTVSTGTMRPYERAPYSAGSSYGTHYQDGGRYGELSSIGLGADAKQRKRRGNLPKETTDKLRAWFVAHLQHPYPTEDEKQDLMRQTGLQMSTLQ